MLSPLSKTFSLRRFYRACFRRVCYFRYSPADRVRRQPRRNFRNGDFRRFHYVRAVSSWTNVTPVDDALRYRSVSEFESETGERRMKNLSRGITRIFLEIYT